jgi:hypothetical protein
MFITEAEGSRCGFGAWVFTQSMFSVCDTEFVCGYSFIFIIVFQNLLL